MSIMNLFAVSYRFIVIRGWVRSNLLLIVASFGSFPIVGFPDQCVMYPK